MAEFEIEIDGKKLVAQPNQTVIQVADEAGIYIPRFCYHKHLSIPANCRMCLVEVEKSPKTLPACATPATPGMKVFTQSSKTLLAQRAVMEFLLINHPLDCPICDQGGECELQDLSMGYGASTSEYNECKRAVSDENLGPLIATEMTRCILCTRCIRFGEEVAGIRELGMTYRGEHEEVSTFVEQAMQSEVSGNIIDICPVGALTSKPYRFTARAWELSQSPGISPHDCIGSNLNVHTRTGKVMRVVARENADVNQTWIADRDRFSYAGLYHADRLQQPMVKIDGTWREVDWQQAFEIAAGCLQAIVAEDGADQLGALASPNATLEEFYLLQKLMRSLGSSHIDHRLRECDVRDQEVMPLFPGLGMPIAELEQCDAVLLIGSNLQKEQPLAALRLRKASLKGARIIIVNPVDYAFNFSVSVKNIIAPQHMVAALQNILSDVANQFQGKQKVHVILGALATEHPEAALLRQLAQKIATACGGKLGIMTSGANAAGAWLAGAIPHRQVGGEAVAKAGLDAYAMLQQPRKAYLLLNVEPDMDCANPYLAVTALKQAKCVIALSMYRNSVLEEHADVILPIAPFTETSGTFVNTTGLWQSFTGVATGLGASRPAWKVLRVLANFLKLYGFDYESSEQIKHEVHALVEKAPSLVPAAIEIKEKAKEQSKLSRIGETPIYATDSLVRRAKPLQDAQAIMEGEMDVVRLHPETAVKLQIKEHATVHVKQASASANLQVKLDTRIAKDAAWIAASVPASRTLGDLFGTIEIEKVD